MTRGIGGFFPLELPSRPGPLPPRDALLLRTGRACLRAILEATRPSRLHVPFYICDAALEPARALGVSLAFYAIDASLSPILPQLAAADSLLIVDYFGVCGRSLRWAEELGHRGIIDASHALFESGPNKCWRFTSARKWFGVPDGAFLWGPVDIPPLVPAPLSSLPAHLIERRWGDPELAYRQYLAAENRFAPSVAPISTESVALLSGVDTELVRSRRRANFAYLHERLGPLNELSVALEPGRVPFCYPFLAPREVSQAALARAGLFVPRFWLDCLSRGTDDFSWERTLSSRLLPLPIDHRYDTTDMQLAAEIVLDHLDGDTYATP